MKGCVKSVLILLYASSFQIGCAEKKYKSQKHDVGNEKSYTDDKVDQQNKAREILRKAHLKNFYDRLHAKRKLRRRKWRKLEVASNNTVDANTRSFKVFEDTEKVLQRGVLLNKSDEIYFKRDASQLKKLNMMKDLINNVITTANYFPKNESMEDEGISFEEQSKRKHEITDKPRGRAEVVTGGNNDTYDLNNLFILHENSEKGSHMLRVAHENKKDAHSKVVGKSVKPEIHKEQLTIERFHILANQQKDVLQKIPLRDSAQSMLSETSAKKKSTSMEKYHILSHQASEILEKASANIDSKKLPADKKQKTKTEKMVASIENKIKNMNDDGPAKIDRPGTGSKIQKAKQSKISQQNKMLHSFADVLQNKFKKMDSQLNNQMEKSRLRAKEREERRKQRFQDKLDKKLTASVNGNSDGKATQKKTTSEQLADEVFAYYLNGDGKKNKTKTIIANEDEDAENKRNHTSDPQRIEEGNIEFGALGDTHIGRMVIEDSVVKEDFTEDSDKLNRTAYSTYPRNKPVPTTSRIRIDHIHHIFINKPDPVEAGIQSTKNSNSGTVFSDDRVLLSNNERATTTQNLKKQREVQQRLNAAKDFIKKAKKVIHFRRRSEIPKMHMQRNKKGSDNASLRSNVATKDKNIDINLVLPKSETPKADNSQNALAAILQRTLDNQGKNNGPTIPPNLGDTGLVNRMVSDLSRALDRQQMSSEMNQMTNTLAQTMLNSMVLGGHHSAYPFPFMHDYEHHYDHHFDHDDYLHGHHDGKSGSNDGNDDELNLTALVHKVKKKNRYLDDLMAQGANPTQSSMVVMQSPPQAADAMMQPAMTTEVQPVIQQPVVIANPQPQVIQPVMQTQPVTQTQPVQLVTSEVAAQTVPTEVTTNNPAIANNPPMAGSSAMQDPLQLANYQDQVQTMNTDQLNQQHNPAYQPQQNPAYQQQQNPAYQPQQNPLVNAGYTNQLQSNLYLNKLYQNQGGNVYQNPRQTWMNQRYRGHHYQQQGRRYPYGNQRAQNYRFGNQGQLNPGYQQRKPPANQKVNEEDESDDKEKDKNEDDDKNDEDDNKKENNENNQENNTNDSTGNEVPSNDMDKLSGGPNDYNNSPPPEGLPPPDESLPPPDVTYPISEQPSPNPPPDGPMVGRYTDDDEKGAQQIKKNEDGIDGHMLKGLTKRLTDKGIVERIIRKAVVKAKKKLRTKNIKTNTAEILLKKPGGWNEKNRAKEKQKRTDRSHRQEKLHMTLQRYLRNRDKQKSIWEKKKAKVIMDHKPGRIKIDTKSHLQQRRKSKKKLKKEG